MTPLALAAAPIYALYFTVSLHGGSMEPGLVAGDNVAVSRLAYMRLGSWDERVSRIVGHSLFRPSPLRGDILVFEYAGSNRSYKGALYVKRVVGLPGDRVQMRDGRLYLNGALIERRPAAPAARTGMHNVAAFRQVAYVETLPEGRQYEILEIDDRQPLDNTSLMIVPADHFFVLGDNRDNSQDSRSEGTWFVPRASIVGRGDYILWSSVDGSAPWQIWRWPFSLRAGRFFKTLQ